MNIQTKYNAGQTLWVMEANKIKSGRVCGITVKLNSTFYEEKVTNYQDELYTLQGEDFRNGTDNYNIRGFGEKMLYPSKEELLKSL